jgi:hypothetical protein
MIWVLWSGSTYSTLFCLSAQDGIDAVRAACFADFGCRAYYRYKSNATFTDLLVKRLQLVRDWNDATEALSTTSYHGDDDVRHLLVESRYRTADPVLVAFFSSGSSDGSVSQSAVNCTSLATLSNVPPPWEIRDTVHWLLEHAVFLADDRPCSESEVAVYRVGSDDPYCVPAQGRVCASSIGNDETLSKAALIVSFIVFGAIAIATWTKTICFVGRDLRPPEKAFPLADL